jgi:3-oxoacyl-[acyl-carrier protein] reductase
MDQDLSKQFSLDGRGAVVIGAGTGIGRQAAVTFAQAGAKLTIADIDPIALDATAELARPWCAAIETVQLDVRDREAVRAVGKVALSQGAVDVWANVAGVISASLVVDTQPEEFDRIVGVNMKGVYWGCATAAALMCEAGRGSIINISSAGADNPGPGLSVYAMTKAAVNMLTRTLAHEVGGSGVRVNAVAPGFVDTPMVTYRFSTPNGAIDPVRKEEIFAMRAAASVLKRIGQPIDIALAMLYLASDASSFMTGQVLRPNGGMAMP